MAIRTVIIIAIIIIKMKASDLNLNFQIKQYICYLRQQTVLDQMHFSNKKLLPT